MPTIEDRISHDELARSLADSLRTDRVMCWQNMQMGPSGSARPDVYTILKSYVSPSPTTYECKVTRSDFLSDVTSGKWQAYLRFSSAVYFAVPEGLIEKKEVPAHCGLIVRYPSGTWRRQKRAVLSPVTIPEEVLIKLLIDGVEREGPRIRARHWSDSEIGLKINRKFGEKVALAVRDMKAVEYEIEMAKRTGKRIEEDAQDRAKRIREEANVSPLREELCEALGLPKDVDRWGLRNAVAQLREEAKEHPAHTKLKTLTQLLQRALSLHGFKEAAATEDDG